MEIHVLTIKDLREKVDGYVINGKNDAVANLIKEEHLKAGE